MILASNPRNRTRSGWLFPKIKQIFRGLRRLGTHFPLRLCPFPLVSRLLVLPRSLSLARTTSGRSPQSFCPQAFEIRERGQGFACGAVESAKNGQDFCGFSVPNPRNPDKFWRELPGSYYEDEFALGTKVHQVYVGLLDSRLNPPRYYTKRLVMKMACNLHEKTRLQKEYEMYNLLSDNETAPVVKAYGLFSCYPIADGQEHAFILMEDGGKCIKERPAAQIQGHVNRYG
ncbi:hypothetical protein GALMADRAFT_1205026 [Galerina marginata CBS 339.88]|uniref:Protein kinase domain-containing protein n=1 Tax=Galerina marginata (strain CBS 339.88) TaxID=685588 RepID=A0A067SEL4_GALM3|nr:hypothetical protein GALMADRAFT_1205026 [Galerina marginata CBS 339.88]